MPNPNQTEGVGEHGSGRSQQEEAPPTRIQGDEEGRFSRDPAEGPRRNADQGPQPSNGGARGEKVRNH